MAPFMFILFLANLQKYVRGEGGGEGGMEEELFYYILITQARIRARLISGIV